MKIYFVANARMPTEKAHGIHIAKMCEALIELGHEVVLVTPARGEGSLKEFYGLRVEVPRIILPSLRFTRYERRGFAFMSASFMVSSLLFLWWQRIRGECFKIYTVDTDSFSHTLLPLSGEVIAEMHSPKKSTVLSSYFFKSAHIIATNTLIASELTKTFGLKNVLVEPNGVDIAPYLSKEEARNKLSLPYEKIALYVGRFYKWKGLEVLAPASKSLSIQGITTLVLGGTKEEFEHVFGNSGDIVFAEARPDEVSTWMYAADVLLLLGTAKNQDSNKYTSPMKVYEYLSTGRPLVTSATEALKELNPGDPASYCQPDDPEILAEWVVKTLNSPATQDAAERRIRLARQHTWRARAERIMYHCTNG